MYRPAAPERANALKERIVLTWARILIDYLLVNFNLWSGAYSEAGASKLQLAEGSVDVKHWAWTDDPSMVSVFPFDGDLVVDWNVYVQVQLGNITAGPRDIGCLGDGIANFLVEYSDALLVVSLAEVVLVHFVGSRPRKLVQYLALSICRADPPEGHPLLRQLQT